MAVTYDADFQSLTLNALLYEVIVEEENEAEIFFDFQIETGEIENGVFRVYWDLNFAWSKFFTLKALYTLEVHKEGRGMLDEEDLVIQTAYPVLSDFSLRIAQLTKDLSNVPLILSALELMQLAGYDLD